MSVISLMAFQSVAAAATMSPPIPVTATSSPQSAGSVQQGDRIKVQTYDIEVRQTFSIPSDHPGFHIIKKPEVISLVRMTESEIAIKGEKIGDSLLLVWEAGGIRSYKIRVSRPIAEINQIKKIEVEGSKLYQSQKERTFKLTYESTINSFSEAQVFPRIGETRKIYSHKVGIEGGTPFGDIRGGFFYEHRKEDRLEKSVAVPRDFWVGLFDSDLPFFKNYDIIGGAQFIRKDKFGFSGERINGLTLRPSQTRIDNAKAGQVDLHFFYGQRRDGSEIDNPPGSQNRELQGDVLGEKIDVYLWNKGKLSLGGYHQFHSSNRTKLEGDRNIAGAFDFQFPFVQLTGEMGFDDETNIAGEIKSIFENQWAKVEGRWFNVNNAYRSIAGSTSDRGNQGFEIKSDIMPLKPFFDYKAISIKTDLEWVRNHLSTNPERPDDFVKTARSTIRWKLPRNFAAKISLHYQDFVPSSFPFTEKEIAGELSKSYRINGRLLRRLKLFAVGTVESFREAVNTAGFNSTRYEAGGGGSINFKFGFYSQVKFVWDRLKEKDLPTSPSPTTYPNQLSLGGGWAHTFRQFPASINLDVRYVDEGKTHNKTHLPFLNEDRLEMRGGFNYEIRDIGQLFVQSNATYTISTVGNPNQAEFDLIGGIRLLLDTGFYIPQKATIEGFVFEDQNGNGVRDPGESGIMGHEIMIEDGVQTESNKDGYFKLKINEGVVTLKGIDQLPEGYFFTTPSKHELEVLPKDEYQINFGIAPQIQVKGVAFLDVNENRIFEKVDEAIPGIQIILQSGQMAVSNSQGVYSLLRIAPGPNQSKVVLDSIPSGYKTTTSVEKTFDGSPGDIINFNVILTAQRVVSGFVFEDLNGNDRKEPNEKGFAGIKIKINGQVVKTNRNGKYLYSGLNSGKVKITLEDQRLLDGYQLLMEKHTLEVPKGAYFQNNINFPTFKLTSDAPLAELDPDSTPA